MFLVSVGTTKFDGLVKKIDNLGLSEGLLQIANGEYIPQNLKFIRFTDRLEELIDQADYVIAHAGAGVLFESLRMGKKVICVPNMERSDKHQIEIAEELSKRGLVLLVKNIDDLKISIDNIGTFNPKKFNIQSFDAYLFCKLSNIKDNDTIAILASSGGHLEEARLLATALISANPTLLIDFYIPFNTHIHIDILKNSYNVHFAPYNAKYRDFLGWLRFLKSAINTIFTSLNANIPRQPTHAISIGTSDTAIIFACLGWRGASRIVIESRARVKSISYSVKILRLFKSKIFRQWDTSILNAPAIGVLYKK